MKFPLIWLLLLLPAWLPTAAAERADSFRLVNARHQGLELAADSRGLCRADSGEWLVREPAPGGMKIYVPARGKYIGDFGQGEQPPLVDSARAAVFTPGHGHGGPVELRAPSGACLHPGVGRRLHIVKSGEQLRVAGVSSHGRHVIYEFRRCMANELYTFSRVGLARDPDPRAADDSVEWLNVTVSDNIGPYNVYRSDDESEGSAGWAGGSHTLGDRKTARTDTVAILADGLPLAADTAELYGERLEIHVRNSIFDPRHEPDSIGLERVLLTEEVTYVIGTNAMEVEMVHTWHDYAYINRYYGMQSLFVGETELCTPGGAYPAWTPQRECTRFNAGDFPEFSRFLERNASGAMQSTWLLPVSYLGCHNFLGSWSPIFRRDAATGKSYHVLLNQNKIPAGSVTDWSGIYSWHDSAFAADSLTAYEIDLPGAHCLVADFHGADSVALVLPGAYAGAPFEVMSIADCVDEPRMAGDTLLLSAYAAGSLILRFEPAVGTAACGWHTEALGGGTDAEALWFMVSSDEAYARNRPFFSGVAGEAIDSLGVLTGLSPWALARREAADALARAEERGVKQLCRDELRALIDSTATADFGAASTDVAALIDSLAAACRKIEGAPVSDERRIISGQPYLMRLCGSDLFLNMDEPGAATLSSEPSVVSIGALGAGFTICSVGLDEHLGLGISGWSATASSDTPCAWLATGTPDTIPTPNPMVTFSRLTPEGRTYLGPAAAPAEEAPLYADRDSALVWELIPAREPVAVTISCTLEGQELARTVRRLQPLSPYSTPSVPAAIGSLSARLDSVALAADTCLTLELNPEAPIFKLVNARFDGVWATSSRAGLSHTADGATFARGEWFMLDSLRIFSLRRLKYIGDFGQGDRAPLVEATDSALSALFVTEHLPHGPVALRAPSGMYLTAFNGRHAGHIGGWPLLSDSGGINSGSCWFMVFDPEALERNMPYYWNGGACRDDFGALTTDTPWSDARLSAEQAVADALLHGAEEEDVAPLRELLDHTAALHFGATDTDVAALIDAMLLEAEILKDFSAIREVRSAETAPDFAVGYNLRGMKVASGSGLLRLPKGVTIVRSGGKKGKVRVK